MGYGTGCWGFCRLNSLIPIFIKNAIVHYTFWFKLCDSGGDIPLSVLPKNGASTQLQYCIKVVQISYEAI